MVTPPCADCGHPHETHHANLAVPGGLFAPGTRPCTVIVELKTIPIIDPATRTTGVVNRAAWWPCSCDDYQAPEQAPEVDSVDVAE